MKKLFFTIIGFITMHFAFAQLDVFVNPVSKDTVISTPFYTLSVAQNSYDKAVVSDKVVGVKNIHKKQKEYWLYFYFMPKDYDNKQRLTISSDKYAYLLNDKGTYLRIPYNGKSFTYKKNELAGFFVDVSKYTAQIKSSNFRYIRFETSGLYYEIALDDKNKGTIAYIITMLTNYK